MSKFKPGTGLPAIIYRSFGRNLAGSKFAISNVFFAETGIVG